ELADKSTIYQLLPQVALGLIHSGQLGKFIAQATEGSLARRIVGNALVHVGGGVSAGAAQQIASNYAEGKPLDQGVGEAAIAGEVRAAPGAVLGALQAPPTRREVRPPVEERPVQEPVARPTLPQAAELQRALNGEVVVPGTPPEIAPVSEAEPWVSKI